MRTNYLIIIMEVLFVENNTNSYEYGCGRGFDFRSYKLVFNKYLFAKSS